MDDYKKPGFDIFKNTTSNPLEHPGQWAWLTLYLGEGGGFTVEIMKIETLSENKKVSLGQMLNFSFSDLVSIFNKRKSLAFVLN